MNTTALLTAFLMTKADGLNLQKTVDALKLLMIQAWDKKQRDFLHRLIGEAETFDATGLMTADELKRIQRDAGIMFGIDFQEAMRPGSTVLSQRAFNIGYKAALNASLRLSNIEAINVINDDFLFWTGNTYNEYFSNDMAALMDKYFKSGATKGQLVDAFKDFFSSTKDFSDNKWGLLADTNITRVAEIGHLAGYEDAGVEYVQIVAVLDDSTSDICQHLHGRKIPVSAMAQQRDGLLDAAKRHDIGAMKRFQPMTHGASFLNTSRTSDLIADEGVGLPPYHFRCRTTTVAYSEPATYHEKVAQMAVDGDISTKDATRLIDFARNGKWGTHKKVWEKRFSGDGKAHLTSFVHYKKHAAEVQVSSMADYNNAAINLIRGGSHDVYVAIRNKTHPHPVMYFYNSKTQEFVTFNIKGQNIATYYKMEPAKFEKRLARHNVIIKLKGGIMKWIKSMLI